MVRETRVEYLLNGSVSGLSVIHFNSLASDAAVKQGTDSFAAYAASVMSSDAEARWDGEIRDLDTVSGDLTALSFVAGANFTGAAVGSENLPQNVALLVISRTNGITGNRRVQGRSFVPFVAAGFNGPDGEPNATVPSPNTIDNAERVVWSRPLYEVDPATGNRTLVREGAEHFNTGILLGTEWATMGSRRRAGTV